MRKTPCGGMSSPINCISMFGANYSNSRFVLYLHWAQPVYRTAEKLATSISRHTWGKVELESHTRPGLIAALTNHRLRPLPSPQQTNKTHRAKDSPALHTPSALALHFGAKQPWTEQTTPSHSPATELPTAPAPSMAAEHAVRASLLSIIVAWKCGKFLDTKLNCLLCLSVLFVCLAVTGLVLAVLAYQNSQATCETGTAGNGTLQGASLPVCHNMQRHSHCVLGLKVIKIVP